MRRRHSSALTATVLLALSGCASFVNDDTHPLHIDTVGPGALQVEGAECTLSNDHGVVQVRSGETTQVQRSRADLTVVCHHPVYGDARARVISRLIGGTVGNVLVGGLIGLGVDHSNARGYSYPTWVQITFGSEVVVDRSNEREGRPTVGVTPPPER